MSRRIVCQSLPVLWATALTSLFCGCQADPSVALMEAEMRWVEDQYYVLEDAYNEKCKELASCRLENQALRGDGPVIDAEVVPSGEPTPVDGNGRNDQSNGTGELPEPEDPDDDNGGDFRPPLIEGVPRLGRPEAEDETPEPPLPGVDGTDDDEFDLPFSTQNTSSRRVTDIADPRVTHIVLNRRLTGGYDFDNKPGHEGLLVVVEPRNAAGQYVPVAGPLAIVLVDPSYSGEAARIARWDLTKEQAAGRLRKSLLGRGIHLELPWPGNPPKHRKLRLFVRYTSESGEQMKTEHEIEVEPIREVASRWTPALDPKQRLAARQSQPARTQPGITAAQSPLPTAPRMARDLPPPVSHPRALDSGETSTTPGWQPYR